MRGIAGRVRRGVLCTAVAVTAGAVFGVGSAGATITQSAITSPSSPFIYQFNGDASPAPTVTVSGTTDSTSPGSDTVDIVCTYPQTGRGITYDNTIANLPLNPDGTFSQAIPINSNDFSFWGGTACTMRALPDDVYHGNRFESFSQFTGPFTEADYLQSYHVSGSGSSQFDYYYTASGSAGGAGYDSVGDCGLFTAAIKPISESYPASDSDTWDCSATLPVDNALSGRTGILIDGRNAYDSYAAQNAYRDSGLSQSSGQAAGFPAQSSSYSRSSTLSGDATISESEGLVSCADASFPATESKCGGTAGSNLGSWQGDGVSLARTVTQSANGSQETVTDTFSSTDGQAHALDLQYENHSGYGPMWKFPGQADYQQYSSGDSVSLGSNSLDAIFITNSAVTSNPSLSEAGALIYNTQPNSAQFNENRGLLLGYQRTVPAGGSISITQTYISGYNAANTYATANAILDQTYKPAVSITSPANNSVTPSGTLLVKGTASAHDNLGLKVDGQTVPVNPDGTWSTTLNLNQGVNTVTAVASDGSGNVAQASETVTYTPTPAPKFCVVPNVTRNKLAKAKAALKKANCRVGRISKVRSRRFRKGTVEHASFSPNVVLKQGTKVGLTEVIGKPKKKHAKPHKKHKHHGVRF
ncbi:MAG: Ig-like domain-containing protein [Solirubrobacteraceae bacterium]